MGSNLIFKIVNYAKTVSSRLLVWYTLITALFRCPSSSDNLNEASPAVCKPYLSVRSHIAPYVEPYYDAYAASHVEKARPYVDRFNQEIYIPSMAYGKQSYKAYGAPRVQQAREYGQAKWEETVRPQIDAVQAQVKKQYDSSLAPQVNKASLAIAPYYSFSRNRISKTYNARILPAMEVSRPYAERVYVFGHKLTVETGLPYAQYAWSSTVVFFDRIIWPKLRILYGDNVEPQLVRIGERLGRYRDGKSLKAVMEEDSSSRQLSSTSSSTSFVMASIASDLTSSSSATLESSTISASPHASVEEEAKQTQQKIESDLRNWQEKFAKAADKGIEDLEERVKEITERQIRSQVHGVGEALVVQLEETSRSELAKLRKKIKILVKKLPEDHNDSDLSEASLSLSESTRHAGVAIKAKAQSLRTWKDNFDKETQSLVSAASESTLDVIDNIRDLGLQEIGLRWAQMEGVTYKDWSKYHEVKKSFDEWRQKVEAVAKDHEGLQKAKVAGEEIESRGMASAEETAKELSRVKEVGQWKIETGDASDDFSTKYVPAAAAAGAQKVMSKVSSASERVDGTSEGTAESAISEAIEKASDVVSSASSAAVGTEPGIIERASSNAVDAASSASERASEAAMGSPKPRTGSIVSAAKDKANQIVADPSETVVGTPAPAESASSGASTVISSASSVTSQASKKVYGGAMAQEVGEQKPILDDVFSEDADETYSERIQSLVNQAGDKIADVTKAVSEALKKAETTQGTVESVSSMADERYSRALSAASSVLYGTETGALESATSEAAGRYAQAVEA